MMAALTFDRGSFVGRSLPRSPESRFNSTEETPQGTFLESSASTCRNHALGVVGGSPLVPWYVTNWDEESTWNRCDSVR